MPDCGVSTAPPDLAWDRVHGLERAAVAGFSEEQDA